MCANPANAAELLLLARAAAGGNGQPAVLFLQSRARFDGALKSMSDKIITEALNILPGRINEVAEHSANSRKNFIQKYKKYGLSKEHINSDITVTFNLAGQQQQRCR